MFSQKTEYELRISDWSSDVCSSDLLGEQSVIGGAKTLDFFGPDIVRLLRGEAVAGGQVAPDVPEFLEVDLFRAFRDLGPERRVDARAAEIGRSSCGKEGVRTGRSRWSPYH